MARTYRIEFIWKGNTEELIFPLDDDEYDNLTISNFITKFKNLIKDVRCKKFRGISEADFIVKEKGSNSIISPTCKLEEFEIGDIYLEVNIPDT